jgi:homoserine kinase type II
VAVFTKLSENDFRSILTGYSIGDFVSAEGIAEGVENTNYKVTTSSNTYILTVYEKRVKSEDLPFFIGLQKKLNETGFPCPKPLSNNKNELIGKFGDKNYTIVSFVNGAWPKAIGADEITEAARALANFHNITKAISASEFSRDNSLGKKFWIETYAKIKDKAEDKYTGLKELSEKAFAKIEKIPENLPKSIIHADYFPDNVLFDGGKVSGVIDFYMACNDAMVYDLAIMINSWCFEKDGSFNVSKSSKLIHTYNSVRPLTQEEIASLPLLCVAGCVRFMCSRLHDYFIRDENAVVNIHDPAEYIEKLRFNLQVKSYKEYGL